MLQLSVADDQILGGEQGIAIGAAMLHHLMTLLVFLQVRLALELAWALFAAQHRVFLLVFGARLLGREPARTFVAGERVLLLLMRQHVLLQIGLTVEYSGTIVTNVKRIIASFRLWRRRRQFLLLIDGSRVAVGIRIR